MKLSTRVRYGVRAMIELAHNFEGKPVPLRKLAENQAISAKYLEQMATALKIAGLITSVRGAEGGYRLARPAEEITVWDIYAVLDVAVDVINCKKNPCADVEVCDRDGFCATQSMWMEVNTMMVNYLKSKTLKQLMDRQAEYDRKKKG